MDRQIILDTPGATLWYYPATRLVHHEIHRYIFGKEFRDLLLKGTEVLRQNRGTRWLSDDRKNGALSKDDGQWTVDVWLPPTLAAGWKAWAMVQPESVIGQMNIKKFTDGMLARGLKVQVFADPAPAMAWLVKA
jgi:hypothetical protein